MSGHYVHVMYNVWHMYNNGNAGSLSCITCVTTSLTGRSGQACHVVSRSIYPLPYFPLYMFDNSLNVQQPRLQQPSSFAPFNTMQLKLIGHHNITPTNNVIKGDFFQIKFSKSNPILFL